MINELILLGRNLRQLGLDVSEEAREYKPLPKANAKNPCLRIYLNPQGEIDRAEEMPEHLRAVLRKYGDYQGSIPAFNAAPLFQLREEEKQAVVNSVRAGKAAPDVERILSWCTEDNWHPKLYKKLALCMTVRANTLKEIIERHGDGRGQEMLRLIKLCEALMEDEGRAFREALVRCAFDALQAKRDLNATLALLFHLGKAEVENPAADAGSLSIMLDLLPEDADGYPVASQKVTREVNRILLLHEHASLGAAPGAEGRDAFGAAYAPLDEPMPSVRLPGFDVIIRTMFSGQPSQYRYGLIGGDSYPMAYENRLLAKSALAWLADEQRQGKTWLRTGREEMVFAYPSKLSDMPPAFVSLFASTNAGAGVARERFEERAKDFMQAFHGLPPKEKPEFIQVFLLRKIDRGRTKLVFTRNYDAQQYAQSPVYWQAGCGNLPDLYPGQKVVPYPLELPAIINTVWRLDGEAAGRGRPIVARMKTYEGIELLLDDTDAPRLRYLLQQLLQNAMNLLLYVGDAQHRVRDKGYYQALEALQGVAAALGLLLYKLGVRKERYMGESAFLMGQILKAADELHVLYGLVERKGSVPPQLAGNGMLMLASEQPVQAMMQLGQRLAPYLTWARQYVTRGLPDSAKAGWCLSVLTQLADQLKPLLKEQETFGDYEKAQLFIGYLASLPRSKKRAESDLNTDAPVQNEKEEEGNEG